MLPHHLLPTPAPIHIPKFFNQITQPAIPRHVSESFIPEQQYQILSSFSPANSESSPDTLPDEDRLPSPATPHIHQPPSYHFANRVSAPFDSPITPTDVYNAVPPASVDSFASQSLSQDAPHTVPGPAASSLSLVNTYSHQHSTTSADPISNYASDAPSPADPPPTSAPFPSRSVDVSHSRDPFPQSASSSSSFASHGDRFDPETMPDRYPRNNILDKYSSHGSSSSQHLDHRRMSEPAVLADNHYPSTSVDNPATARFPQQIGLGFPPQPRHSVSGYLPNMQRGISFNSLRDLRQQQQPQIPYPSSMAHWRTDGLRHHQSDSYSSGAGDEPISPFQTNFSGGALNSPTGLQYTSIPENLYGSSPPGTAASSSSNNVQTARLGPHHSLPQPLPHQQLSPRGSLTGNTDANHNKTYAFVSLPGNTVKKRPRRRYDEIERLYTCSWPECTKAYGTLNHLNAHVTMQKHGVKRSPNEFKELRKQWRKAKKDAEQQQQHQHQPLNVPLRRASMGNLGLRPDERDIYDAPRFSSGQLNPAVQTTMNTPLPMHLTHPGHDDNRYNVSIDQQVRYSLDNQANNLVDYTTAKQRYTTASSENPGSWHSGVHPQSSSSSSRQSMPQQYLSSSLANMHHHHQNAHPTTSQFSQLVANSSNSLHLQFPQPSTANRLPPNSTLLTPYQPPASMVSQPSSSQGQGVGSDELAYPPGAYEVYEDNTQRSGGGRLGHRNGSSGEEYEQ